jgi:type II secretory pathway predicted ATPase ExeA
MDSILDIYTEFFGLNERPFSLVPDPSFMYWSPAHIRAYTMLEYGIVTRAPITMITGEVGSGKTTLLHHLLNSLDNDVRIGLVSNALGDRGELLRWILLSLDQPSTPGETYVDLFGRFQKYLIQEYTSGRRVVLIFDEAQNLSRESLEELRMFTNINSNKDELLQLVLAGQPELRDLVRRPDLRQFAQRIASSFHLPSMNQDTMAQYIAHRMKVAGGGETETFTPDAMARIFSATGGIPRLVNQLCDFSLVYAYAMDSRTVSEATVQQILDEGIFLGGQLTAGDFVHPASDKTGT